LQEPHWPRALSTVCSVVGAPLQNNH
jgi:hypothetical protein